VTRVSTEHHFADSPDKVWDLIADLGASRQLKHLPGMTIVVDGEGLGAERTVASPNTAGLVERITWLDAEHYEFGYSVVEGDFPLSSYVANMRLRADGEGCVLTWSSSFKPGAMLEDDAVRLVEGIYRRLAASMHKALAEG